MDQPTPIPNLPTISVEEIHANNLAAFRLGNETRHLLHQGIRAIAGTKGALDKVQCTSIAQYAKKYFKMNRSETYEAIRVEEALDRLPLIATAYRTGAICWTDVQAITRLEKPAEEKWIAYAKDNSSDQVTAEVQRARNNNRNAPAESEGGLPRTWIDVYYRLDVEEHEVAVAAFRKVRAEEMARPGYEGPPPGSKDLFLTLCRWVLRTDPTDLPKDRIERIDSASTVLYRHCPVCRELEIHTEDGFVKVNPDRLEEIEAEAKKVRIRPEEEEASPRLEPPEIDPPTGPALLEKALHCDGLVCSVPGCGRRIGLQGDHIVRRSEGGRTELANLEALCQAHHAMKEAGLLTVRIEKDGKRVYETRTDNLTAAILAEAERELRSMPQVVVVAESRRRDSGEDVGGEVPDGAGEWTRALEGLGHGTKEARRRVDRAIEELRSSGREVTGPAVIGLACSFDHRRRRPA